MRYAGDPTESADESPPASSHWWSGILPGLHSDTNTDEQNENRVLLQIVQPALVGLMDGSVSTLAPIFATAYATHTPHTAFLVGVAAAVGAGISMGFAEALSDSGEITGRGHPIQRGAITGGATFFGGIFHTVPFLLPNLQLALYIAYLVVGVELMAIALIRHRFFDMSMLKSAVQVILGGALVFVAGVLIGSS
ncbi:MAG TPA: VIT1/CCC1 transporter family protein [Thermomicrobiaceae bacterium]|nr:VIT1/CCC1 transporter family protein [Thermomicrobiaceae bacterium]